MNSNLARAFSYLIALQFQALAMIFVAYWGGNWLNEHHPIAVNWYLVTFTVAVLGIGHTFYVVIRHLWNQERERAQAAAKKVGGA